MEFDWTEEQRRLREAVLRFARDELDSVLDAARGGGSFPAEAWRRCAQFGVQGLPIPKKLGGMGADLVTTAMVLEALGLGCRDNGLLFAINAHLWSCALPLLRFGSEEQRDRYLPALCDGSLIGVQAVTESASGSDALAVRTTAESDGDHFVLNGSKTFITNAPIAGVFIVLAATSERRDPGELVALVVERDTPGVHVSAPFDKVGLTTVPMGAVSFDDCRVPATAMLVGLGAGMTVFNTTIEWERSFIGATILGTLQRQLDESVAYAATHRRFGQPIGKNQAVAHRLVEMRARLEAGKLLQYRVAWLKDRGERTILESSIVKLFISEAFVASSLAAFELHGASAYLSGATEERNLRDALASRIYSGTSDIQRNIVARMLGL